MIGDAVFTGDTLFMPDYGTARADFPGGDSRQLFRSIRRLMELPERTRLFHCHDYKAAGRDSFAWETTVGAQRASNVHVHEGVTEDDFVTMRDARDATLSMPRLILPSIQVNMRGGHLPEQESNGTRYLKLPWTCCDGERHADTGSARRADDRHCGGDHAARPWSYRWHQWSRGTRRRYLLERGAMVNRRGVRRWSALGHATGRIGIWSGRSPLSHQLRDDRAWWPARRFRHKIGQRMHERARRMRHVAFLAEILDRHRELHDRRRRHGRCDERARLRAVIRRVLFALVAGALFGAGLAVSGMADPQRVRGFLDVFGAWDPTLAFVMGAR